MPKVLQYKPCPICGKRIKRLTSHMQYSHPEPDQVASILDPETDLPSTELLDQDEDISEKARIWAEEQLAEPLPQAEPPVDGNKEAIVAKMLYDKVVSPLCESSGIKLGEWADIDQQDYFLVAGGIIAYLDHRRAGG